MKTPAQVASPRLCAHRGLSRACPENTLPAFAAALAVGADEIEFDLWSSRDGVAVVCHDETVDRTTAGTGRIADLAWDEIRRLDAGIKQGWYHADDRPRPDAQPNEAWRGTRVPRLEEVLEVTAGRIGLNIHIKNAGPDGRLVRLVCDLLRKQGLLESAYIAGCTEAVLRTAGDYAPEVARACLLGQQGDVSRQVELARQFACQRIQIWGSVNEDQLRQAHAAGLICNYFWSDNIAEARELVRKGIDVILTNCAHTLIADGFHAKNGS
jgi:glycerophosphoryl diester phosphodiesterase